MVCVWLLYGSCNVVYGLRMAIVRVCMVLNCFCMADVWFLYGC